MSAPPSRNLNHFDTGLRCIRETTVTSHFFGVWLSVLSCRLPFPSNTNSEHITHFLARGAALLGCHTSEKAVGTFYTQTQNEGLVPPAWTELPRLSPRSLSPPRSAWDPETTIHSIRLSPQPAVSALGSDWNGVRTTPCARRGSLPLSLSPPSPSHPSSRRRALSAIVPLSSIPVSPLSPAPFQISAGCIS